MSTIEVVGFFTPGCRALELSVFDVSLNNASSLESVFTLVPELSVYSNFTTDYVRRRYKFFF